MTGSVCVRTGGRCPPHACDCNCTHPTAACHMLCLAHIEHSRELLGHSGVVARHDGARGSVMTSGLSGMCLGMAGYGWMLVRHDSM